MTLDEALARLTELRESTPNSGGFEMAVETYIGWVSIDKIKVKHWFARPNDSEKRPFVVMGDII